MARECDHLWKSNGTDTGVCDICGEERQFPPKQCPKCGNRLVRGDEENERQCLACGVRIPTTRELVVLKPGLPITRYVMRDFYRRREGEIVADSQRIGTRRTMKKWHIRSSSSLHTIRVRHRDGAEAPPDNGGSPAAVIPKSKTSSTPREKSLVSKKVSTPAMQSELDFLRGYRRAVEDIFSYKGSAPPRFLRNYFNVWDKLWQIHSLLRYPDYSISTWSS